MRTYLETRLTQLSDAVNLPFSRPEEVEHLTKCFINIAENLEFLPDTCRLDFAYNMITVFSAMSVIIITFDPSEEKIEELEILIESSLGISFLPKMDGNGRKLAEWDGVDIITMIADKPLDEYEKDEFNKH